MKNTLHIGGILLVLTLPAFLAVQAQPLSWNSSFTPVWGNGNTNGNANNIDGKGLNIATTVTISGGAFASNSGQNTPSVQGSNIVVAGSSSRIKLSPNFNNAGDYTNIVVTFSKLTSHISFRIGDIDKQNGNSNSYYDRVTISGSNGATTFLPTVTKYDATTDPTFLIISGNVAHVNTTNGQGGKTNSNSGDQRGTIHVDFGTALLTSVTIKIDNTPGVQANPATQDLAIGEFAFIQPALPVKLIAFSGAQNASNVDLKWTTAQEINSEKFEIQRSSPRTNWESIGSVSSAGNSDVKNHYSYTDLNVAATTLLYRLKQIDVDGKYEYSPVIKIENKNNHASFRCYPNPFSSFVNVTVYSPREQTALLLLTDVTGRKVMEAIRKLYRGNNSFTIAGLEKQVPGIFFATLSDEEGDEMGRYRLIKR